MVSDHFADKKKKPRVGKVRWLVHDYKMSEIEIQFILILELILLHQAAPHRSTPLPAPCKETELVEFVCRELAEASYAFRMVLVIFNLPNIPHIIELKRSNKSL